MLRFSRQHAKSRFDPIALPGPICRSGAENPLTSCLWGAEEDHPLALLTKLRACGVRAEASETDLVLAKATVALLDFVEDRL